MKTLYNLPQGIGYIYWKFKDVRVPYRRNGDLVELWSIDGQYFSRLDLSSIQISGNYEFEPEDDLEAWEVFVAKVRLG